MSPLFRNRKHFPEDFYFRLLVRRRIALEDDARPNIISAATVKHFLPAKRNFPWAPLAESKFNGPLRSRGNGKPADIPLLCVIATPGRVNYFVSNSQAEYSFTNEIQFASFGLN